MKKVLLTFDVEEFDIPIEFGQHISELDQFDISRQGLVLLLNLLKYHQVQATFFTTASFAKKYPSLIKQMSEEGHEISSHAFCHADNCSIDFSSPKKSKKELEKIINKEIKGFRAPRFQIKDISELHNHGFTYDSSTHPTIAPGRYMRLTQKRKIHKLGNIIEIPPSTLPLIPFLRAPINWHMFRHFPRIYRILFAKINFLFSNYLMLVLHPWEFVNIEEHNIPKEFTKKTGKINLDKLEDYILFCKKNNYVFETISNHLEI